MSRVSLATRVEISGRLKGEMRRLGIRSGDELAQLVGVSRATAYNYTGGYRSPTLATGVAMEAIGFDMQFVMTGLRNPSRAAAPFAKPRFKLRLDGTLQPIEGAR